MDSADLAEVVNGQTKELNFVKNVLDTKDAIVKNTYEAVNTVTRDVSHNVSNLTHQNMIDRTTRNISNDVTQNVSSAADQASAVIQENIAGSRSKLRTNHVI